jgi:hypothetical protein
MCPGSARGCRVVGDQTQPQPYLVSAEAMARKPRHLHRLLTFFDPLLGRAGFVVEAHHRAAGRREVDHDKAHAGEQSRCALPAPGRSPAWQRPRRPGRASRICSGSGREFPGNQCLADLDMPSLRISPWIRGAPQGGLAAKRPGWPGWSFECEEFRQSATLFPARCGGIAPRTPKCAASSFERRIPGKSSFENPQTSQCGCDV